MTGGGGYRKVPAAVGVPAGWLDAGMTTTSTGPAPVPALPSFDLFGRTALVSGAARGLGAAIAVGLAAAGADVALGLRDVGSADGAQVAAHVEALGRRAVRLPMDVADPAQARSAVAGAVDAFGRLDILVNNAGIAPGNDALDVTEADFDATVSVNLKGTFFACQAAARVMAGQGFGRIVNLSSQAGIAALPGESVYCMTKAGISHLTKCLAVEWGPLGITVNAVAPTFIRTPGTASALADPAFEADVLERVAALHRIGDPVDVAGAVVYLVSPAAALVTGHTLVVDGGWTAR